MSNSISTIQGDYPLNTFQTLRDLWQQMAKEIGEDAQLVTNIGLLAATGLTIATTTKVSAACPPAHRQAAPPNLPQFSLLQSDKFQALLTGSVVNYASSSLISIEITLEPLAINLFIQPLISYLPPTVTLIGDTDFVNDRYLQRHFIQLLSSAISIGQDKSVARVQINDAISSGGKPEVMVSEQLSQREIKLQQQVDRAELLNYISTQIHQTLDLSIVLQSTVEQVQAFLHADRLIIYQLEFAKTDGKIGDKSFDSYTQMGKVAYEAIGVEDLSSVLDTTEYQDCFDDRQLWDKYCSGMTRSIDQVELEYAQNHCMLELMDRYQIRSKLVIPIIVNQELWGLLIAHQCRFSRNWKIEETRFLQQISEHLAFAINQSELYAISLSNTQDLEQRVNERTRELRDAVIVAQTANQSKTEFLALLSHELRTPLTSILGLSGTLLRLPLLNLTDRQQKYLQTIHNSGEHLSELVDDILDFYKLEVGKTFLKVSEFSLSKLIKQVVRTVRFKAENGKIDLQVQIINDGNDVSEISGRDLRFRGDTKRIHQILLNILNNAVKFTPEDGTVIIRAWLEDNYAVFEIEDSGIGIEEAQIPRLFKKFHQLNRNFDRDYEGMGLGLAITQQLVELHGGSIEVDSSIGSGSTFTVRIAAQPLQVVERNDWVEMDRKLVFQDPELNPISNQIVLIESDEDLASFMCDILTAARYQVTWLLSAESSFRQISMFKPDVLIIDLTPSTEIVDRLIGNIRRSSTISNVKILGIANKEDNISPISKQHVDDYLWKPTSPEQLLRKITKLLS
jgi:two-component system, sensor histidine kinase and response regulator